MIHTPPCCPFSGTPSDCAVAPGTAMVMWPRACSLLGPRRLYQIEPNSGLARLPSFSACAIAAVRLARSVSASNRRFCAMRSRLAMLLHSLEYGYWPGSPDVSMQTMRFVPLRTTS